MARSKFDPNQIVQMTFDETLEATRVSVLPMEMSIELNAEDGDSVLTQKQMQIIQTEADQIINTEKASRLSITTETQIFMVVGEIEISLGTLTPGQVKEICTPAIRVASACTVILQS